MSNQFLVTVDSHLFKTKPTGTEAGGITARMQKTGATEFDAEMFSVVIREGATWCGGCFKSSKFGWGAFESMQICALDFDNSRDKQQLHPGEIGFISEVEALERCNELGLIPLMTYSTMSASDDWQKFRVVFDLGEPVTDKAEAETILQKLVSLFPESDQACKNVNRLFFGSNGNVRMVEGGVLA